MCNKHKSERNEFNMNEKILVVDDEQNICELLTLYSIKEGYSVETAGDGEEAMKKFSSYAPDLILLDIMLPKKDGWQVCREIRAYSKVPIIMLTAKTNEQDELLGFQLGVDEYISKPFSKNLLKSVIFSLLDNRNRCREYYSLMATSVSPVSINNHDTSFIDKVSNIIEEQISNENLSIDYLSEQLHLSRTQVYRKVKALTGYSPVELVKMIRMKKASYLLTTTEMSISEIAYNLGFSTPSYFTKVYKEFWGETPLSTRERI